MSVYISNKKAYKSKVELFREAGNDNIHVISDFDRTLTYNAVNGNPAVTSFSIIRNGGYLSEEYAMKANKLFEHFHPIEVDHTRTYEERKTAMDEWWRKHMQLIIDSGMTQEIVDAVIADYPRHFRAGAKELFELLHEKNIPILIFSAGIGNFIEGWMRNEKLLHSNVHIVSNFFSFDNRGKAIGYEKHPVHVFNKHEAHLHGTSYVEVADARDYVILMGDSIGDARMDQGLEHKEVLKIGFLHENTPQNLDEYTQHFDMVYTGDPSFSEICVILKDILWV